MAGLEVTASTRRPLVRDARINAREIGLRRDLQHRLSTNFYISLPSNKLHLSLQREGDPDRGSLVLSRSLPHRVREYRESTAARR